MNELNARYQNVKKRLFEAYYSKLNDKQKEAVFSVNGPLLVLAGAGSGKTTVLVNRIAHIIDFGNAYYDTDVPNGIDEGLVFTFESILSNVENISRDDLKNLLQCGVWGSESPPDTRVISMKTSTIPKDTHN